jgi:glycine betaine/proline transport system substrate-binding protein
LRSSLLPAVTTTRKAMPPPVPVRRQPPTQRLRLGLPIPRQLPPARGSRSLPTHGRGLRSTQLSHASDYKTYIDEKKSVVNIGKLGPSAKIGWYVPTFVIDQHPELKTWEGFKDPELSKLFATAESGDLGQFLMGDPSYVTYDEQIIKNLSLPLKYVVAGSEAALITAIEQSETDQKPLLLQFWQPHWLQSKVKLTQVELPAVTDECLASAAAADGNYACDYPVDELDKIAGAGLEAKNKVAFDFLSKFQLTTDQQNEVAAMVDSDGKTADAAAQEWVAANPDVVAAWLA